MIRVVILDDDINLLEALSLTLQQAEGIEVVNTFSNAKDAMPFLMEHPEVDVCLTDLDLGFKNMTGIEFITRMKSLRAELLFLVLTVYEDQDLVFQALTAGALGYIIKSSNRESLLQAIQQIYQGGSPMSSSIARKIVSSFSASTSKIVEDPLSEREREVLRLISMGKIEKEVANELYISISTVKNHISNIYTKLQVHTRVEALNKYYGKLS